MEVEHAGSYTISMCGLQCFAKIVKRTTSLGSLTRDSVRGLKKPMGQSSMVSMSGLARSCLQHPEGGFNSKIAKIMASLLLTMGVVTGGVALADERLELSDKMVPQRPGMKTAEDYQRFVHERGLPERSEPTAEDMDRLRAQSQRELKVEEEYARRNSSNVSSMSDDEILNAIRLKTDYGYEPPPVDAYEDWPKSPEEFEKKYGRPPQRREEVDFYFGGDDDVGEDQERTNR